MGAAEASAAALAEIESYVITGGTRCGVGPFIATLSQADQEAVQQAHEAGLPNTAITRFLAKRGFKLRDQPVSRHLRGVCGCEK